LRQAIHALKYHHVRDLAIPLSELLLALWRELDWEVDLVLPVPLYPRRQRERGYNQSALLAAQLTKGLDLTTASPNVLKRVRHTRSQTGLDAAERRQNVSGAFFCQDSTVRGQRVLLVDDVCTTGATLDACARALKGGGAHSVHALTVARTMMN
jgi:ComF family protein